jgi:hypothetical protein
MMHEHMLAEERYAAHQALVERVNREAWKYEATRRHRAPVRRWLAARLRALAELVAPAQPPLVEPGPPAPVTPP